MEENQPTYSRHSLREDYVGETSGSGACRTAEESEPLGLSAEALFYALPYMSLKELLCMEQVCKASRGWVREGGMLWRKLRVEPPLNRSFTDEILIQFSKRSNGELECLCLVDCFKITDRAVEQVVLTSPRLSKLFLPGCNGITAEGVINMVRAHTNQRAPGVSGIKELRLRNIAGLTEHQLQSLLDIMGVEKVPLNGLKPRYYNKNYDSLSWSSERPIDVEVCPKCTSVRMVFDCCLDMCRENQQCRACLMCTVRCADCGVCVNPDEAEATVCYDYLCTGCWLSQQLKCSHCNRPACSRHARSSFTLEEDQFTIVCGECIHYSISQADIEYVL